jgi:hypothetical protein
VARRGKNAKTRRGEVALPPEVVPDVATAPGAALPLDPLTRRHLRFGWMLLCVSLPAGLVLEALHGLKVEMYLGPDNELRRLLWTLAHAHGTLLALANIAYAFTASRLTLHDGLASRMLIAGAILLPAGFLGGGVVTYGGDPGPTIVLAPVGGLMLAAAVIMTGREVLRATRNPGGTAPDDHPA